jgi:D-inositol-3-phosphate glycosyltransferase
MILVDHRKSGFVKTKILIWSDYTSPTGFSNVMSNIARRLSPEEFEIDVLAVGYLGDPDYDHERFPGRVFPARTPPYTDQIGRLKLLDMVGRGDYDTIFALQDVHMCYDVFPKLIDLRSRFGKHFKLVYYFPIDSPPLAKWIFDSVGRADIPVAYTQYGYDSCVAAMPGREIKIQVIPHGVDRLDFYPWKFHFEFEEIFAYREAMCPGTEGKFLVGNINRNQPRKDIIRTLIAFAIFKRRYWEDSALYLHMSINDVGGDFRPAAEQLGLKEDIDFFLPKTLTVDGFSVKNMNLIYNMLDVVMTTSLGEGWGLSLTEAMATMTPVIGPDHSSISEILDGGNRGCLVRCGDDSDLNLWTVVPPEAHVLRPLTDVENMAFGLNKIRLGSFSTIVNAYAWVQSELDWNKIVPERWVPLLCAEQN